MSSADVFLGRHNVQSHLPGGQLDRAAHLRVELNPAVVAALAEIGVDVTKEFPKPLTDEVVRASDVVVLGCGDACPVYRGKRCLDWDLPDPAGLPIDQVRPIRDEIDHRVRELLAELTTTNEESNTR